MPDPYSSAVLSAKLRGFYASLVANPNAADPRVTAAFAAVPREPFAGPGPWSILTAHVWQSQDRGPLYVTTPVDDPAFLYQDVLVALDAARGINIGQPSLHALCLDALAPRPGETVVRVGTGSGYYTALLAHLVGPDGLNAGAPRPARAWLDALRPAGRLLFPLQAANRRGGMLFLRRATGEAAWPARFVSMASFIPLKGMPEAGEVGLSNAFAQGPLAAVRSIHFDAPPDASCWHDGGDWCLSTHDASRGWCLVLHIGTGTTCRLLG
jgi:protein-L-isoaspartate(D-aspartate) O-methyltransferase